VRQLGFRRDGRVSGAQLPPAVLLSHDPEIMLGMLVAILSLYDVAAPRCILRRGRVALVVVARVLRSVAPITRRANAGRSLVCRAMSVRSRAVVTAIGVERSSAALVQDSLRC
jgi:hypothetical protein